ncbi:MAG: lysophospholipid acyltransferase family protein, partial [Prevotellaceae bacterium]|nr:lysophospholipid acyltransferase family protein [Prevotellaceae bacterium]
MKYIYWLYQLCIAVPVAIIATVLTAAVTGLGCSIGNGHVWGYYPGRWWSKVMTRIFLLTVTVEGRENLEKGHSYVFVANHQGMFDIFLIYGYLNRNFKWMMKRSLRKMPFIGMACEAAHHIFVDKRGPSKIRATYDKARATLREGMSLVVFPEGARTF